MIKYEHLCGKEFSWDNQYCYTMLRDLYRDNWGIELSDIACPEDYATARMDLCSNLAEGEGFYVLHCHPRDYRPGDVFLMAIQSPYGNHIGILLDDGRMLHHLPGQISGVTTYGGIYRNNTVAVYRHRDVPADVVEVEKVEFLTLLPPSVRKKVEEMMKSRIELQSDISSTAADASAS